MPEPDSLWPETTSDSEDAPPAASTTDATSSTSGDTIVDEWLAGTTWTRADVNVALNVAQVALFLALVYLEVRDE